MSQYDKIDMDMKYQEETDRLFLKIQSMMNYMFNECEIDGIKTGVHVQKEIMEK